MRRILLAPALVIVLLISLLATAPARLLGFVLPEGQVIMQGFSGTLWRGTASRCLVRTGAGYLHMGTVAWKLEPWSLLLFAPRLSLDSTWGRQTLATGIVLRGSEDLTLSQLEAAIPAELLQQFFPVRLAGTLSVQVSEIVLRGGLPVEGAGRLVWRNGTWQAPGGPVPLGSYALDFSQQAGAALDGTVLTLAGPVSAEGKVKLEGRAYSVDIGLRSEGALDARLQQAVSLVARPEGEGYRIKLDGDF